ncbi:hypothetical protein FHS72_001495 [Loktanella ponticola]|uniref:PAS domain-containing protein n=1 Tax=Yoonia ponticola TaxID=1524255 RepID=A0A7W9EZE4_9RHOB|nr:PAS domain-containing protein [Yoonia ponticola]MBB5721871.1 hypothetical protein [Yoonia ponticola]
MAHDRDYASIYRTPFHDPNGEAVLKQVERHWRSMRNGDDLPQRVDLSPDHLSDSLAHCFTLERVAPTIARFRVAGRAVHEVLNMEPRGMPLSALFTPAGRDMLAPLIFDVCEGPDIVEVPVIAARSLGRSPLRGRLLLMPLKHAGQEVNRLFGAVVVDGKTGRRPMRFDFDRDQSLRQQAVQPIIRTVHEILSEPTVAHPAPRPALRLIVDNT